MDLKERPRETLSRHPWEMARLAMIRRIVANSISGKDQVRLLDIGCGDGFVLGELAKDPSVAQAHGLDIHLTDEELRSASSGNMQLFSDPGGLSGQYDVVLLGDVLEHVEDDEAFLRQIITGNTRPGTILIILVPVYQALFNSHDIFLAHYRRYSAEGLLRLIEASGLDVLDRGSMFFSLLFPRWFGCMKEKLLGPGGKGPQGLGHWRAGKLLTRVITGVLTVDNGLLWALSRGGVRLPGLSLWVVARRPA